jgi:sporulation protein YlmC with PRC-barrel domain
MLTIDPCLKLLMTETTPTGTQHLVSLEASQIKNIENTLDANPCPTPPVIPFTWQTYGNHVNSNNRWIGTIENFDFNIKTNSILRMNVKNNGTINLFTVNSNTVGAFVIKNNDLNKNVFKIQNNGATYIGSENVTNGPHTNALLTVSGKVACKEIRVFDNGSGYWADFVFDKNYKLMTLKEVEVYYNANSHLPNIPTAKDIATDGNDLAKTDALLLQKIEELTLYIVQQQKEIEALKKEMKK